MPKNKAARDPWERWKGLVLAAKERLQMTDEEIAARLVTPGMGVRPPCRQTVTKWRKAPETMPMWAFARINRVLGIEAAAAREAAVVWQ